MINISQVGLKLFSDEFIGLVTIKKVSVYYHFYSFSFCFIFFTIQNNI